jgi:hypothetical protein
MREGGRESQWAEIYMRDEWSLGILGEEWGYDITRNFPLC